MNALLQGAAFGGGAISDHQVGQLVGQAFKLLSQMRGLSERDTPPKHLVCAQ
jgi:hypothetical protein